MDSAPVGLMHPEEDLWRHWMALAPVYYGAGQVLTAAGIPWRVIQHGDPTEGLSTLLTFRLYDRDYKSSGYTIKNIHVPALPGWAWQKLIAVAKGGFWHDLVEGLGLFLMRSYHSSKLARRTMDKLNMAKLVTQTALFNLPDWDVTHSLLDQLPKDINPRVKADLPVLIKTWQKRDQHQVHLMNYAHSCQTVEVRFDSPVIARIISPDTPETLTREGKFITFNLDIYSVLLLD
jgi:hypothetical protein